MKYSNVFFRSYVIIKSIYIYITLITKLNSLFNFISFRVIVYFFVPPTHTYI